MGFVCTLRFIVASRLFLSVGFSFLVAFGVVRTLHGVNKNDFGFVDSLGFDIPSTGLSDHSVTGLHVQLSRSHVFRQSTWTKYDGISIDSVNYVNY